MSSGFYSERRAIPVQMEHAKPQWAYDGATSVIGPIVDVLGGMRNVRIWRRAEDPNGGVRPDFSRRHFVNGARRVLDGLQIAIGGAKNIRSAISVRLLTLVVAGE